MPGAAPGLVLSRPDQYLQEPQNFALLYRLCPQILDEVGEYTKAKNFLVSLRNRYLIFMLLICEPEAGAEQPSDHFQ